MSQSQSSPTAAAKRAVHPDFVPTFSLAAVQDRLPLTLPVPADTLPSPKIAYLSHYAYLGAADLADAAKLATLSPFEVALRLVDFSSLRDLLAGHYARTARGQRPYDPVSMFLAICLRREQDIGWSKLATLLVGEHGAGWRRLFGFQAGRTPCPAGLRGFFNAVGEATFDRLCPLFGETLLAAGLASQHSTFPGDGPERGVTITHDIMLHEARSGMRCLQVTASCYQPRPRPCPARAEDKKKKGCDCQHDACKSACRYATPLDPEARLIHYTGRNRHADLPDQPPAHGRNVYGYASNPDRLIDDRFACAWTLRTSLHPANADERKLFPQSLAALRAHFPDLAIGEVLGDAALGFACCLDPIWDLGALRMIDIRAASEDADPERRRERGYDDNGHPLCHHGYPMQAHGHDYQRRRTKWSCQKACLRHQAADPAPPAPPCPYQAPDSKLGQVVHIGRTLPDDSPRLAREIPYRSDTWCRRYGRRNLSESRNGTCEHSGLKRSASYGRSRTFKEIATADFLENLRTLARLVTEATRLAISAGSG
jgi:hypothetical protein